MNNLSTKANLDQSRASDPMVSAWVSANAGSGKTHMLVNRVIRLMLTGTPPEKILCLTFTKAAAAEMSNRLYERLAEWIPLSDDELIEKIHLNTGHIRFGKDQLAGPRRLFARALETPGGLKIQTIHAFCENLLHRFPIEAGITSGFNVMDDREASELIAKVRLRFFENIEQGTDENAGAYVAEVIKHSGGQQNFDDLLKKLLDKRNELQEVYQNLPAASVRLAQFLEIEADDTVEKIISQTSRTIDRDGLIHARQILKKRSAKTDLNQALTIEAILASLSDFEIFENLKALLLTGTGKQKADSGLCTKNCGQDNPETLEVLQQEAQRLIKSTDKIKAIDILKATDAILHLGKLITEQYSFEKDNLGLYDYHDLIEKALAMFADMPNAAWVLYKLDGGLDHILVDEAQDTSPAQWDIIQFLADDFFTGAGARPDIVRSIFAVGDRKQSIYSFQGAKPESFDQRGRYFQNAVRQAEQSFESVNFEVSFRSTAQVLDLVDQVFSQVEAAKGVENTVHSAQRKLAPGFVELWPIEEKVETEKSSIWQPLNNEVSDSHPRIRLAYKIARKIQSWLENGEILLSKDRPIKPSDILILVRQRTQFMNALVRALKQLNVPVAGVDRLKLTDHIGVQDLLAIARFVLLPHDDLNFAGVLKSSLLEKDDDTPFNDDDLIAIAAQRGDQTMWDAFLSAIKKGSPYANAKTFLEIWLTSSKTLPPFEFYSRILSVDKKRVSILNRLGSEAGEPLDALLLSAQEFERNNIVSLQGFLSWIERGDTEIKREMEKNDEEVRIMTVHGAKGLEANIVILPDTFDVPDTSRTPPILNSDNDTPVWRLKKEFETEYTRNLKNELLDETLEEYNRLLYVAMTRACDRLYIGAAQTASQTKNNSWYKLISNFLQQPSNEQHDKIFGTVWRQITPDTPNNLTKRSDENKAINQTTLPDWIFRKPPAASPLINWMAPSVIGAKDNRKEEIHLSPSAAMSANRFLRGNLIHRMLQYLPEVASNRQMMVAREYIQRHGAGLTDNEQSETLNEISSILTDERFSAVFAPGSLAEVPVVAKIKTNTGREVMVNGQIDRLCVLDNKILIVDYKTNKPPPKSLEAVNPQYISQLATYRLALHEIYPDCSIVAGLLWTHNGNLMEVDEDLLIAVFEK